MVYYEVGISLLSRGGPSIDRYLAHLTPEQANILFETIRKISVKYSQYVEKPKYYLVLYKKKQDEKQWEDFHLIASTNRLSVARYLLDQLSLLLVRP